MAGEAVEHRLHGEETGVAGQAVLDRPEKGQRPDAEDERCGDEGLGDAARLAVAGESLLEPSAQRLQPVLEAQQLADGAAEHHGREDRQIVAGPCGRIGQDAKAQAHPEQQDEHAEPIGKRALDPWRQPAAEQHTHHRADEHGHDVEDRAGQEHRQRVAIEERC